MTRRVIRKKKNFFSEHADKRFLPVRNSRRSEGPARVVQLWEEQSFSCCVDLMPLVPPEQAHLVCRGFGRHALSTASD